MRSPTWGLIKALTIQNDLRTLKMTMHKLILRGELAAVFCFCFYLVMTEKFQDQCQLVLASFLYSGRK